MRRAFKIARGISPRRTSPNPRVGCVLVKGGKVVGTGAHLAYGKPHAEPNALARAGSKAKGATAYITMEPCGGFPGKKTPPCAGALAAAGVRRVVCAALDPNPKVAGRSLAALRRAGVAIARLPEFQADAEELNRGFFSIMRRRRPWVILKTALSLDGKAAAANGKSRWVTGKAARTAVHRMRAELDAILVGSGTVLADDPALTVRALRGRDPQRVILDGRLRVPASAKAMPGALVATARAGKPQEGLLRLPGRKGRVSLPALLDELGRRELTSVLVEGGADVHGALLREGLVDEVAFFIAPALIGGDGLAVLGGVGVEKVADAVRLARVAVKRLGDDLLVTGRLL